MQVYGIYGQQLGIISQCFSDTNLQLTKIELGLSSLLLALHRQRHIRPGPRLPLHVGRVRDVVVYRGPWSAIIGTPVRRKLVARRELGPSRSTGSRIGFPHPHPSIGLISGILLTWPLKAGVTIPRSFEVWNRGQGRKDVGLVPNLTASRGLGVVAPILEAGDLLGPYELVSGGGAVVGDHCAEPGGVGGQGEASIP